MENIRHKRGLIVFTLIGTHECVFVLHLDFVFKFGFFFFLSEAFADVACVVLWICGVFINEDEDTCAMHCGISLSSSSQTP